MTKMGITGVEGGYYEFPFPGLYKTAKGGLAAVGYRYEDNDPPYVEPFEIHITTLTTGETFTTHYSRWDTVAERLGLILIKKSMNNDALVTAIENELC